MNSAAEEVSLDRRPARTLLWIAGTVVFAVGIYASARFGIRHAEDRVPDSALEHAGAFAVGEAMIIEPPGDAPLVFAATQDELREYFFREGAEVGAGMARAGGDVVFEHRGDAVRVRILERDADLLRVDILSGPRAEGADAYWTRQPVLSD